MCSGSPPGEGPEAIVEESSFAGGEVFSALVEEDESTFALLDEGGATLGDLDELKYPPPPGLENAEYALRGPPAERSRWAKTDMVDDEQRPSGRVQSIVDAVRSHSGHVETGAHNSLAPTDARQCQRRLSAQLCSVTAPHNRW